MTFRFLTAGESHGPGLGVIVEGLPAGVPIAADRIAEDLHRRQLGYGRGARMRIEQDRAQITGGVRHGRSIGSPILMFIENRDWPTWTRVMQVEALTDEEALELLALAEGGNKRAQPVTRVRPGHGDLAGALKYRFDDVRGILERASARETAARVAAGAVARAFLRELGIEVWSHTVEVAGIRIDAARATRSRAEMEASPLRCPDAEAEAAMVAAIDRAQKAGDTLGGVFEVVATGVPVGIGSHVHWDRRLDAALAAAIMSIHAVKGVEFGLGFEQTRRPGSEVHDVIEGVGVDAAAPILPGESGPVPRWRHRTNNAGGVTAGMSNGEPIVIHGAVKPISTLAHPLPSADLRTGRPVEVAHYERSDVSVVPAAGVVGEAMTMVTLAAFMLEKFGGDSLEEVRERVVQHRRRVVAMAEDASAAGAARLGDRLASAVVDGEAGSGGDD